MKKEETKEQAIIKISNLLWFQGIDPSQLITLKTDDPSIGKAIELKHLVWGFIHKHLIETDQETKALRQELEETKYKLSEYQDECNNLFISNAEQKQKISELEKEKEDAIELNHHRQETIFNLKNQIQSLSARLGELEEEKQSLQESLNSTTEAFIKKQEEWECLEGQIIALKKDMKFEQDLQLKFHEQFLESESKLTSCEKKLKEYEGIIQDSYDRISQYMNFGGEWKLTETKEKLQTLLNKQ